MSRYLADSNVLIDVATNDPTWRPWSEEQLLRAAASGEILVNPLIYAEIANAFESEAKLDRWLDPRMFARVPLPFAAAWSAAQDFTRYRRLGGQRTSPLPDFYIGAPAEAENLILITRDATRYRTYYPGVRLVCPS